MGIVFVNFFSINVLFKCHAEQLFSGHGHQNLEFSIDFDQCLVIPNMYCVQMK